MKQVKQIGITICVMLAFIFFMGSSAAAQDRQKEKAVKAYYDGFETHDWNLVAGQLANDFTFTSPVGDNRIPMEKYHEKCWPTNKFFKTVKFVNMVEKGNELYLLVEINTTDNKLVRNLDIFTFDATGKIKGHECFFGAGEGYPGKDSKE